MTVESMGIKNKDELEKIQKIASSYKNQYQLTENIIQERNHEIHQLKGRLLDFEKVKQDFHIQIKNRDIKLDEAKERVESLIETLDNVENDVQTHKIENKKLKEVIEKFNMTKENENNDQNYHNGAKNMVDSSTQDEIMKIKFENNQLRRQLDSQKPQKTIEMQPLEVTQIKKQNQKSAGTMCKIAEEMLKDWLHLIHNGNGFEGQASEITTGRMLNMVGDKLRNFRIENSELSKKMKKLEFQKSIEGKEDNEVIQQQSETIQKLSNKIQQFKDELKTANEISFSLKSENKNLLKENESIQEQLKEVTQKDTSTERIAFKPKLQQQQQKRAIDYEKQREYFKVENIFYFPDQISGSGIDKSITTASTLTESKDSQASFLDDEIDKIKERHDLKIKDLKSKLQKQEKKVKKLEDIISTLEAQLMTDRGSNEQKQSTQRESDALSSKVRALKDQISQQKRDIKVKQKLNEELNNDLKATKNSYKEIEEQNNLLITNIEKEKEKLKTAKRIHKKQLFSSTHENTEKIDKKMKERTLELKDQLSQIKDSSKKFQTKLLSLSKEKKLLSTSLSSQIAKNMMLSKENNFLRKNYQENSPSESSQIELEFMSIEDTEDLIKKIFKKAIMSLSLQESISNFSEFFELSKKINKFVIPASHRNQSYSGYRDFDGSF